MTNEAAISATLTVNAPQAASVVEIAMSPGQRLEQAAPLVKLARLSPLWAEIAIPASNIRAIRTGASVEIEGYATPGKVVLVSETTDAATQTILVRAEISNNGELHPGQTAAARLSFLSAGESAWEIPYSGLVRRGEQTAVFVATMAASPRPVGFCGGSGPRVDPADSDKDESRSSASRRFAAFSRVWGIDAPRLVAFALSRGSSSS